MATKTVTAWNPFGVSLDITATTGTVTRTSATTYTVAITASWNTHWSGNKTNYGMTATSGGKTVTINPFGTKASAGHGSFTGTYSISGNGAAAKTITVTFKNFNSDNGDSKTYNINLSVSVPAWTSYVVKYNTNGGSGSFANQTKWRDQKLTLHSTKPTRTGYSFLGWGISASDTSVDYAAGASYTANAAITLYAIWKANTYTVTFNANGGTGAPGNQTKTYGTTLTLSSTKPTRTNYNFLGWSTSSTANSAIYSAGGNYTDNSAVTLYAVWELAYTRPRINGLLVERCSPMAERKKVTGNPITVNDVSQTEHTLIVNVKSKNLLTGDMYAISPGSSLEYNGLSITLNSYYGVAIRGTVPAESSNSISLFKSFVLPAGTYTVLPLAQSGMPSDISITTFWNHDSTPIITLTEETEVSLCFSVNNYTDSDITIDYATVNLMIVEGTADYNTPYTSPITDYSTVTVSRYGKNIFNPKMLDNAWSDRKFNFDNESGYYTRTAQSAFGESIITTQHIYTDTDKDLTKLIKIPKGYAVTVTVYDYHWNNTVDTSKSDIIFALYNADGTRYTINNAPAQTPTIPTNIIYTYAANDSDKWLDISTNNREYLPKYFSKIQVEFNSIATEYEPFDLQTVTADADGEVRGLTSTSPSMTLTTDTEGAIINLEYVSSEQSTDAIYVTDDEGTHALVEFGYECDKSVSSIVIAWTSGDSDSDYITIKPNTTTGTVSELIGGDISPDLTYTISITVTDANGYSEVYTSLPGTNFAIDVKNGGNGISFGKPAELDDTVDCGWTIMPREGFANIPIPKNTDLDDVKTPNTYVGYNKSTAGYVNCPVPSGTFTLEVFSAGAEGQVMQRITQCSATDPLEFTRMYYSKQWHGWIRKYPVTLYAGSTSETVNLSESVEKFKAIDIYFVDNNNKTGGYTRIYDPNDKTTCLSIIEAGGTVTYIRRTNYTISGASLAPNVEGAGFVKISGSTLSHTSGTNYIRIIRVMGYDSGTVM
jgi:uncharacterized repeat protein (TIGR02543 family)